MNLSDNTYPLTGERRKIGLDIATILSAPRTGLHRLGAIWTKRLAHAREMRDLYRFSDRDLWDLGLGRSDVRAIERGTFRRD